MADQPRLQLGRPDLQYVPLDVVTQRRSPSWASGVLARAMRAAVLAEEMFDLSRPALGRHRPQGGLVGSCARPG